MKPLAANENDDPDAPPALLTDTEATDLAVQIFGVKVRLRRRRGGRTCVVELRDVLGMDAAPIHAGVGATWEQAFDAALARLGR